MQTERATKNPTWWNDSHTGAWDRVKDAMKRDWEQTKSDLSKHGGTKLNQQVGDTVKQAAGTEAIPKSGAANVSGDFRKVEPAYRYGVGLSTQFPAQKDWNPEFENRLAGEWSQLGSKQTWSEAKGDVKQGFERARKV